MPVRMRVLAAMCGVLLLATSMEAQRSPRGRASARNTDRGSDAKSVTLTIQGTARRYLIHAPSTTADPIPLVLAFHGGGETPDNQESISHFDALSDRAHFIVVYPEGVGKSWADGRGTTAADKQGIDDVAFARAIVADVARTYAIDRTRVFATGPSNGGIFVNTLGCAAADVFAAIGPVIGTIAVKIAPKCRPSAPVAVIGVQGVDDPVVPFAGGEVGGILAGAAAGGTVESSRKTQELWRSLNGCAAAPRSIALPVRVHDGTSVTTRTYSSCRGGADVVWNEIAGGGHRWPPSHPDRAIAERMADRTLGVSSQNIDASEVIWEFFAEHPRR